MAEKKKTESTAREDIVIGKDILELLSYAMYADPLSIYREYIQNSADSIDDASNLNLYKKTLVPRIDISISQADRSVKILDNGAGINKFTFKKKITAFGGSKKRGSNARGFRGVGRLAGLGYCQELIFRTRAQGEPEISEIKWDCRKILQLLRDDSFKGDLKDVVKEVTQVQRIKNEVYPDHFFEVELRKISRLKNDILLNEIEIKNYLAQVGPVPFSPEFKFKNDIEAFLNDYKCGKSFNIYINNSTEPVYKLHRNTLKINENLESEYDKPVFFEIAGNNGENSGIGWRLDHNYLGAIPFNEGVKGFRARAGNIQVGNENIFSEIFTERRFNSWAVGEVHILDKKIQPNGRRDNFGQNSSYSNLLNHLSLQAKKVSQLCRELSLERNRQKEFYLEQDKIKEKLSILKESVVPKGLESTLKKEIGGSLEKLNRLSKSSESLYGNSLFGKEFDQIRVTVEETLNNNQSKNPLDNLPKNKKLIYEEVFDLICECEPNRLVAKSLIDKIVAKIKIMY